jgi:hypothetical protein
MTTDTHRSGSITHSQIIRVAAAVIIVCGVTAYALWAHFSNPPTSKYEPVIEQLASGKLNSDEIGNVSLAGAFAGLTPKDEMYLTRRSDGSFLAFFPTYCGPGVCVAGLVYTSRPLQEQDTYYGPLKTVLDRRLINVGSWPKLQMNKKLDDHWYMVSRGL